MLIGITQRVVTSYSTGERRDALEQGWINFLESCGIEPLLIPNCHSNPVAYVKRMGISGIILTGGNNLSPAVRTINDRPVDNLPHLEDTAPERDNTETALLRAGMENNWPMLGVCRGMQLLNVFHEGKIRMITGHAGTHHTLTKCGNEEFPVHFVVDETVNSFHNCGILEDDMASECRVWAKAGEVVEALIHGKHRHLGIMWHPERNKPLSSNDIILFRHFFH